MRRLLQALFQGLSEMLLAMPLLLVLCHSLFSLGELPVLLLSIWVYYGIGSLINTLLHRTSPAVQWLALTALSAGGMLALHGIRAGGVAAALLAGAACYRGIRFNQRPWGDVLPIAALWASFPLYFVMALFFVIYDQYQPYTSWLFASGVLNVASVLLVNNQLFLQSQARTKDGKGGYLTSSILSHNRMVMAGFLGIVLVIGLTTQIGGLLETLRDALLGLFAGGDREYVAVEDEYVGNTGGDDGDPTPSDNSGTSLWERIYMFVISTVVAIVVIAGLGFLAYILLRRMTGLKQLLSRLFGGAMREPAAEIELGYEDEKEQLLDLKGLGARARAAFASRRQKPPSWGDMKDNRSRLRFLYETLVLSSMKEGLEFKRHHTPDEVGDEMVRQVKRSDSELVGETVGWYNKVRYGGKQPDDAELERLRKRLL
ncbi:DUF4129 domain-containing protein [Paenibacillus sp. 1P07SE]|uniref:DUF4129 domain-containing protein n=1 Tax=Paenibacillus sp. 1P07SE TaxID=3132209 RepID=UPI0039A47B9D